jgi:hypothetical protein
MKYACPLCKKPVSLSLYRKITGIWEERQKLLGNLREQRAGLVQKIRKEKERLRREAIRFRRQKTQLIKRAVDKKTRALELQMETLRRKEKQIERRTRGEIRRATALAHSQAEKQSSVRFKSLEKRLRASFRKHLREEKGRNAQEAKIKYEKLNNTFRSTLSQMKTKTAQIQAQRQQIIELERQLRKQTTPQIEGLLHEGNLLKELKKHFPEDKFEHPGKGGDIIQVVMQNGQEAGVIVYECKRVRHYSTKHVTQALEAKEKRKADFAILVTNAMKKGTHGFYTERGVSIIHATGVLSFAHVLRDHLVQIAQMKLGQLQRKEAIRLTLEYLEGPEFANSMDAILRESVSVYDEMMDEVKKHVAGWNKRYISYKKIQEEASRVKSTSKAMLSGEPEYKKLIQIDTLPALVELPKADK